MSEPRFKFEDSPAVFMAEFMILVDLGRCDENYRKIGAQILMRFAHPFAHNRSEQAIFELAATLLLQDWSDTATCETLTTAVVSAKARLTSEQTMRILQERSNVTSDLWRVFAGLCAVEHALRLLSAARQHIRGMLKLVALFSSEAYRPVPFLVGSGTGVIDERFFRPLVGYLDEGLP